MQKRLKEYEQEMYQ